VIVDGRILKRDGRLVDADLGQARDLAETALDYLLRHTDVQPQWVQSATGSPAHSH
jgi:hypothetical protein